MIKPKMTGVSLCSGIGCQERGLENAGCFDVEMAATSEINIDSIICYAAIHHDLTEEMVDGYQGYPSSSEMRRYLTNLNIGYNPEKDKPYNWYKSGKAFERKVKKVWLSCMLNKNLGDVSRIERLPKANIWFLSFPCTDLSNSGKMAGMEEGSGTRSSLVWNTLRLLEIAKETNTLPEYMMLENVRNLVGRFIHDFNKFNEQIFQYGYNVDWGIIDAKNAGIPQHRERAFALYIRADIDKHYFKFPKPFDNGIRIKDILADDVDESYYIKSGKARSLILGVTT